jgi:thiol-disulfide isomerase/thioredoxin
MKRTLLIVVVAALSAALASASLAAVDVGDSPELSFKPVKGTGEGEVSLAGLKGKIVVVDFWATWCGPCMAEAEHMVELNKKYSEQGVQFLGVSLDQDQADLLKVAKEKGFSWPQQFDGQVWKNKFATAWGVKGIPKTFVISPEGKVLWAGHPAQIDKPLAAAVKEHPPVLVDPKIVADAVKQLDQADSALSSSDTAAALKLLGKIPADARKDGEVAKRTGELEKKLEEAADKSLVEVDGLIEQKNYREAAVKLQDLSKGLGGSPAGEKARKKLAELNANPDAKAAIALAEKSSRAEQELAAAQKLADERKDDLAYPRFQSIAKSFAGTDAAATADAAVKAYEANAEFMKHYTDTAVAGKAKASFSMAESYKKAGRKDLAKKKYQTVVDEFPGTSYAEQAAKEIAAIK